jgi:hypothetical protein
MAKMTWTKMAEEAPGGELLLLSELLSELLELELEGAGPVREPLVRTRMEIAQAAIVMHMKSVWTAKRRRVGRRMPQTIGVFLSPNRARKRKRLCFPSEAVEEASSSVAARAVVEVLGADEEVGVVAVAGAAALEEDDDDEESAWVVVVE